MKQVLRRYNLVGISAPQIGVPSRIILLEASEQLREKYPAAVYKARGCEILPMTVSDWLHLFACSKPSRFYTVRFQIYFYLFIYIVVYF